MLLQVSKLGFGCMSLSGGYNSPLSEEDGISIIKHAFSKGITFFDTADKYGPYTNEILLGKVRVLTLDSCVRILLIMLLLYLINLITIHIYIKR